MRIVHCIPSLEPAGAERQLAYLAEGLVALGHEVHVATMEGGALVDPLRSCGVKVVELGWREPFDPSLIIDLARLFVSSRAEVVQTWLRRMDIAGGVAALATRTPWIYSERTVWQAGGWRQDLRRRLIERASAIAANSDNAAAVLKRILRREKRFFVIPNALPQQAIDHAPRAMRASLGIAEEAELVLFVGRFASEKNIALLASALGDLLVTRPRAFALCCGEGPLREPFVRALSDRGVGDRLHACGQRSDVWSWLRAADVLVSTSRWEGRPNAVLEAMAVACPLALTDIAAHRELVDESTAALFPSGDATAAVQAIARVLDDRAAARERAERSQRRVGSLSVATIARAYADLYRQLA